ncbi:MAG: hypothetical protein WA997_14740 [Anaerolineales bacterium]
MTLRSIMRIYLIVKVRQSGELIMTDTQAVQRVGGRNVLTSCHCGLEARHPGC